MDLMCLVYLKETVTKSTATAKGTMNNAKITKPSFSTLVYEVTLSKALFEYKKNSNSGLECK